MAFNYAYSVSVLLPECLRHGRSFCICGADFVPALQGFLLICRHIWGERWFIVKVLCKFDLEQGWPCLPVKA